MTEIQGKSILVRVSEGSSYRESTVPNTICPEGSNLGLFVVRNVKWPSIMVYITTSPTSSKQILIIIFVRALGAGNIVPRVSRFLPPYQEKRSPGDEVGGASLTIESQLCELLGVLHVAYPVNYDAQFLSLRCLEGRGGLCSDRAIQMAQYSSLRKRVIARNLNQARAIYGIIWWDVNVNKHWAESGVESFSGVKTAQYSKKERGIERKKMKM